MAASGVTNYQQNKIRVDWLRRGQTFTQLVNTFIALLTTTKGPRQNSVAYVANDTISLTANDGKTHLYKCTTGGTTAAAQASLYPGANNEAITDNTAVFTEQDSALRAGVGGAVVEAAYTGYARISYAASLANWAGTQGAGTSVASTGTGGVTSNNNAITFGAPTSGPSLVWAAAEFDALTVGNMLDFVALPAGLTKTLNNGDAAPFIAAGQLAYTEQ